jgi:hypothetical protein
MVQDRTLSHRIGGLADGDVAIPNELNFLDPAQCVVGPFIIMDPPGFEYWLDGFQVGNNQWEEADIVWTTGTVAGLRRPDGTRGRLPIELRWSELAKIAATWRRDDMQRARHAEQKRIGTQRRPPASKRKHDVGAGVGPAAGTANGLSSADADPFCRPAEQTQVVGSGTSPPDDKTVSRPKPTDRSVRQLMRDRVKEQPDDKPAPTEDEDFKAVEKCFGERALTREDFRSVRRSETPKAWRTQGPRKPWGVARKKKSAV